MAEEMVRAETVEAPPAKMEFRLINPTEAGFLKHIEWNKEELEAAVRAKVDSYKGIVYTEDTLKSAKADRAELNNLLKAIEDRRKKVKEIINQPYADFEKELKSVTALIKSQTEEIGKQIDSFEDRQREEKKQKIQEAYDLAIGDLKEVLPFTKVFDPRYLNKTYKLNTAISEVNARIEKVKRDLETIESVCGKYALNAKDVYVRTLDLSKALAEEKRLKELEEKLEAERIRKEKEAEERRKDEEQRRIEAERLRKEEEERRAEAARAAEQAKAQQKEEIPWQDEAAVQEIAEAVTSGMSIPETEQVQPAQEEQAVDPFEQKKQEPAPEKKVRAKFFAIGTREQLKALTQYMKDNGIKYGKVE
ncbi:MAG: DUF1351 domain-containing protein [Eubacteriales bacterium]|nr:DUF1351 domain-containing protein [Eubacteriales bacterium]